MNFKLTTNETLIAAFPYCREVKLEKKEEHVVSETELFVTDKRVVLIEKRPNFFNRQEILLENIKGVNTLYSYNEGAAVSNKGGAKALIFFGIILIPVIIGIFMIAKGVKKLKASPIVPKCCSVTFDILTDDSLSPVMQGGSKVVEDDMVNGKKLPIATTPLHFTASLMPDEARRLAEELGDSITYAIGKMTKTL